MPDDTEIIRQGLRARFRELAERLCPGGRVDRIHYKPLNPVRADRHPGSFVLDIAGPTTGRWTEFAETGASGKPLAGDAIDLIAYVVYGGITSDGRKKAFDYARDFLGLTKGQAPSARERDAARIAAEKAAKDAAELDAKQRLERARRAGKWWISERQKGAATQLEGSIGHRYLNARRMISFDKLGRFPGAILCVDNLKARDGSRWPGLLTCMTRWQEGRICAVHRTFLDPVTGDKAALANPRLTYGDVDGAAMRLWKGIYPANVSMEKHFAATGELCDLMVHEGLEDGLTWAMNRPERAHWSAATLGNLGKIAWPGFADRVTVVFDNDYRENDLKYNRARAEDRKRIRAAWLAQAAGRGVEFIMPSNVKDSNDVLRRRGG